ncbi:hypothetical protein [Acetivibrio cellulolyticus]|uniref:hypothetical protein n=1 Tax=Acetivibrio cellulolyticus TaxID=35830 RepID=UPI0001E2C6A9|nr:hypothetical protein [Acetivibrio cellulolyticus]
MKTIIKFGVISSVIISITFSGCSNSIQTSKENEIVQMKEEIENLKSEINVLQGELEKKNEIQTLLNSKNESSNQSEGLLDVSYISVNKKKVSSNIIIVNERGLNLNALCNAWNDISIEIQDYSDKQFGGYSGDKVPTKFKVSFNGKFTEFEGIVYASSVNGEPMAEYIGGEFGDIRARYKSCILLKDKGSVIRLFELLGIGCTFNEDNSLDLYKI